MKQNLFNKLWLRVGMIVAIMTTALAGTAWAETTTYQHIFNAKPNTGNNVALSSVNWNITAVQLGNYNSSNYAGVQIGTKSASGSITLTSSSAWGGQAGTYSGKTVITEVRLWLNAGTGTPVGTVTIGGVAATSDGTIVQKNSSASSYTDATMVTYTPASNGNTGIVVINVSTPSKAGYICAMEIDCEEASGPVTPTCEMPTFSPVAGTYTSAQNVTISTETTGATIYYTTDGSAPSTESSVYSSAIAVSSTTTIKAMAVASGYNNSSVASATYTIVSLDHAGTEADPYTVADARTLLTAAPSTTFEDVYVSGIISQVDSYNSKYNSITYWISDDGTTTDQFEVYSGKGLNGADFSSEDDLIVGSEVTVKGNIKKYNSIFEFDVNSQIVSLVEPTYPIINVENATLNLTYDATSGEIEYTITNPTSATLTATSNASWISDITVGEESVTFTTTANNGTTDREATITLSYTGAEDVTVTVTQDHYVADYATLPFEFEGGRADIEDTAGLTQSGLGSDYGSSPKLKFDNTGDYVLLTFNARPGVLTFDIKGNSFSGGTFKVQASSDGTTFNDVATYTELGDTETKTISNLAASVRYIKWVYTEKVSGNVALGNINLAQYVVLSDYTLTIDDPANVTITATYGEEVLDNGDNAEVTQGTEVSLVVTPATGYVFQSLTIAGAEEGQTVTPTETNGVYTFTMPAYDVTVSATVVEYVAPVTAQYALATSITSGKTYVIANADGTKVMGGQNSNNRAAVDATLNGTTLTAANACEFVIEGNATDGYTIYDGTGYLYAASSTANHLKTQAENNGNGIWKITFGEGGVASVVAEGSSNRNVMQYNSNSTLFSCYASASQSPVYFYEKVEEVPTSQTVIVSPAGYATIVAEADLTIPAGVEVFAVTVNGAASSAHLEAITGGIPSGAAVLVKASAGEYVFNSAAEEVDAISSNDLKAATTAFNPTAANTIYCLAQKNGTVGFYPVATSVTIPVGKAYLEITSGEAPVKGFYGFDDDATAISSVESFTEDGAIYNLAGQRLQKMQKGINIVNGKKILK